MKWKLFYRRRSRQNVYCPYLLIESNVEKIITSFRASNHLFILAMMYEFRFVRALTHLQSTINCSVTSFFGARTIETAHLVFAVTINFREIDCLYQIF